MSGGGIPDRFWRALCRVGFHAMRRDERRLPLFLRDLYAMCQCGREHLPMEVVDRESWRLAVVVQQ